MFETVTVDQAIARGQRMVNYPVFTIMFGIMGLSAYLTAKDIIPGYILVVAIPGAIILAWLYWSFMITKWRIWAFDNVRNVHKLKKRAIESQLIWPDGSLWEKTEIRSVADKEKLRALESKFKKRDIFTDDYSAPQEVVVYYSKARGILNIILVVLFGPVAGVFLIMASNHYIIGWVYSLLSPFGIYFYYSEYKYAKNKTPLIILNQKGIQTVNVPFCEWKDIENEGVVKDKSGTYLVYDSPAGSEKLNIVEYNINRKTLKNLLHVYRVRSNTKPAIDK